MRFQNTFENRLFLIGPTYILLIFLLAIYFVNILDTYDQNYICFDRAGLSE